MPVKLQVPERYATPLAEFLKLEPAQVVSLLEGLKEEKPTLEVDDLVDSLADRLKVDRGQVQQIFRLLSSLHITREGLGVEPEEFVAQLRAAMEMTKDENLRPSDWSNFEEAVKEVLTADTALSVSAKALDVLNDHERVYCYARILTDLRPVFRSEVERGPAAMVTVHTLKLVYHEDGEHKQFFVALDKADAENLVALLGRALKKENSLKALTAEKGITVLEVKP